MSPKKHSTRQEFLDKAFIYGFCSLFGFILASMIAELVFGMNNAQWIMLCWLPWVLGWLIAVVKSQTDHE